MYNDNRTSLRLSEELRRRIIEEARKENRTMHNMIITILLRYFSSESPG